MMGPEVTQSVCDRVPEPGCVILERANAKPVVIFIMPAAAKVEGIGNCQPCCPGAAGCTTLPQLPCVVVNPQARGSFHAGESGLHKGSCCLVRPGGECVEHMSDPLPGVDDEEGVVESVLSLGIDVGYHHHLVPGRGLGEVAAVEELPGAAVKVEQTDIVFFRAVGVRCCLGKALQEGVDAGVHHPGPIAPSFGIHPEQQPLPKEALAEGHRRAGYDPAFAEAPPGSLAALLAGCGCGSGLCCWGCFTIVALCGDVPGQTLSCGRSFPAVARQGTTWWLLIHYGVLIPQ